MKTVFGVASIPQREKHLKATLASVLPQADLINVYLNNYPNNYTPEFLQNDKIFVYRSQAHGDRSDAGKFFNVLENCRYFGIDDDLIYPPGYADYMNSKLDEYYGQIIVSHQGRMLKPHPLRSYYRDKRWFHRCLDNEPNERFVHVGGTGVMAFDTNYFRPTPDLFKMPHMADIWIGIMAQQQKMPILALAHKKGYIKYQQNVGETIHSRHIHNDITQTRVANSIKWMLHWTKKPTNA